MRSCVHSLGRPLTLTSVFLAAMFLVACEQSKQTTQAPAAAVPATAEKVFVVFEGPWAFVTDPKNANSVLALAPKTKGHRDLYVAASNDSTLAVGVYDLSIPAHSAAGTGTLDPSFAQAKIDAPSLQHALDDKSGRYVIRLPKPEAYVAAKRTRSRVGSAYPPDASSEQNYASEVSLRYSVSSLNGFAVAGTPDTGTFNPLLLQVDTPTIRFGIEPAQMDDPLDKCDTHSREAFRDLAKFLSVTLFVDFPENPIDCHSNDVQKTAAQAQGPMSLSEPAASLLALLTENRHGGAPAQYPIATAYFFHVHASDCKAPILFLTTTP